MKVLSPALPGFFLMRIFTPIKLNLGLAVLGRTDYGYHNIQSLLVCCDIGEWLELEPEEASHLRITGPSPCETADNLITKARNLYPFNQGTFHLIKSVPPGSGLGAGSSNAAGALKLMNQVTPQPRGRLHQIACELGSDIPFFLQDGPSWAEGRGTHLTPAKIPDNLYCVVIRSKHSIVTSQAFERLRTHKLYSPPLQPRQIENHLKEGHLSELEPLLPNSFQKLYEMENQNWMLETLKALKNCGLEFVSLSGSGSACYGLTNDETRAHQAWESLKSSWDFAACGRILSVHPQPI